ncbi:cysteine desulfurase family protein [Desertibacillus haloalkaliphilus]|uniref:cysteine desulfurase family protein n=1 Tax=Desertibacillus haloalkaliphilus TaxID=1328930 RepID=UPI001C26C66A|nr:cysteine desulfurase family protein [Desertibacillus haloalkaliphilus]MBU8905199.1 cysteine desulfurase [Desertibacillus haloalkaliphilus]
MIYFDNSATTKPYPEVLKTFTSVSERYFGNPSSLHSLGAEAERLLTQAREVISSILSVRPREVIFTSGGTEGNNLAIKGIALQHQNRGKHLITTEVEHASSYEIFQQLEKLGFDITYVPVDKHGLVSVEDVKKAIRKETILISMIHVNNELGSVQPIEEIAKVVADHPKIHFHVDHVQGVTKVPLNLSMKGIDLCTISGHKFHGLKGTGVLYIREGVTLFPLMHGGVQELQFRAGTENTAGIIALAKALRLSVEQSQKEIKKIEGLKRMLIDELETLDGIVVNTSKEHSAPHIVNFSIVGVKPEVVIQALTKKQIYVSTKSACSSKLAEPSRVLVAAGLGHERASSAIRVSFSFENEEVELVEFVNVMKKITPELLDVMR